jgi:hypothetical protein
MQQGMSTEEEVIIGDSPNWMKADVSPPKSGGEEEGAKSLQFGLVSAVFLLLARPLLSTHAPQ